MKKTLILGLFPIFLLSFVSKWHIDAGIRIPYYHIITAAWFILTLPFLYRKRIIIPPGIQILIFLKFVHLVCIAASFLLIIDSGDPIDQLQFAKGIVWAGIDAAFIITILLFLTQLNRPERSKVILLFLWAVAGHIAFLLTEAASIYLFDIDVDILISTSLPFWPGQPITMTEDMFYLSSLGTIYRLSGFTSDPNVAGVSLALALPVIFVSYYQHPRTSLVALALLSLICILATVSNTAIPIAGILLIMLSFRFWRGRKLLATSIALILVIGGGLAAWKQTPALIETMAFKLAEDGSASSHMQIAKDAWGIWLQHPLGVGFNNFAQHSAHVSTHNSYIQALVELGIPGICSALAWVVGSLLLSLRSRNTIGKAAMLVVGALAIAANGHDLLFRFEFQLIAHLLVAMAVVDRWQESRTTQHNKSCGSEALA